jgi:hypothetical protein
VSFGQQCGDFALAFGHRSKRVGVLAGIFLHRRVEVLLATRQMRVSAEFFQHTDCITQNALGIFRLINQQQESSIIECGQRPREWEEPPFQG